jgi:predicted secreted Zn-dependent protease
MIIPAWPNMTDPERAAVARYRSAIQAHEEMHFDVTDTVVKALQRTVTATGTDPADATRNLQAAVTQYGADAQAAIETATHDYDATTQHGKTQSALGGVDVHLDCGGGGTGGSSGSGSSSSSSPGTDASLAADLTGL